VSIAVAPIAYEVVITTSPDQVEEDLLRERFDQHHEAMGCFRGYGRNREVFHHPGFLWASTRTTTAGELRCNAILPDDNRVLRAYRRGRLKTTSDKVRQIEWQDPPEDQVPRIYRIMPDYGGAYAWNEAGACTGIAYDFPDVAGVTELEARIDDEWQSLFELGVDYNGAEMNIDFDWDSFHALGIQFACELKDLLGERANFFYEKPYEDLGRDTNELMAIVGDEGALFTGANDNAEAV